MKTEFGNVNEDKFFCLLLWLEGMIIYDLLNVVIFGEYKESEIGVW